MIKAAKNKRWFKILIPITLLLLAVLTFLHHRRMLSWQSAALYNESTLEMLESLPYLAWAPIPEADRHKSGVTKYDSDAACAGYNLYHSGRQNMGRLIDMRGKTVRTWRYPFCDEWHVITLDTDGNLYFIEENKRLGKLNWHSSPRWVSEGRYHHWIDVAQNGRIYTLERKKRVLVYEGREIAVLDDLVTILSPTGEIEQRVSVFEAVKDLIPARHLDPAKRPPIESRKGREILGDALELFHTNSVEYISRDVPDLCRKGDVLVSIKLLDLLAIIDVRNNRLLWSWGPGLIKKQHSALFLNNNHILLFDNGDKKRRHSRIIELDPLTRQIVWMYQGDPPQVFYSAAQGGCQLLPNGNILTTNTNRGHVFEVTRDKRVVWGFFNPDTKPRPEKQDERAGIYRMTRIPARIYQDIITKHRIKGPNSSSNQ